jgi:hypothetical protein
MRLYPASRTGVRVLGAALLGAALALPALVLAQSGGVSCFLPPAKLPDKVVAQFSADPASLLAAHPTGGPTLMAAARRLAGSDVRTVDALIEIAKNAAPEMKADIAAGLANTAASCVWTRPDIAQLIQEKIAAAGDAPLSTAFLHVLRAGGTPTFGGTGGPRRDFPRVGGVGGAPAASEPSTQPGAITVDRLPLARRGVDIGVAAGATGVTSGGDNSATTGGGTNVSGGGASVSGGSTGGPRVNSAGSATSGANDRSSGGGLSRASRFNSNIRPSQTSP